MAQQQRKRGGGGARRGGGHSANSSNASPAAPVPAPAAAAAGVGMCAVTAAAAAAAAAGLPTQAQLLAAGVPIVGTGSARPSGKSAADVAAAAAAFAAEVHRQRNDSLRRSLRAGGVVAANAADSKNKHAVTAAEPLMPVEALVDEHGPGVLGFMRRTRSDSSCNQGVFAMEEDAASPSLAARRHGAPTTARASHARHESTESELDAAAAAVRASTDEAHSCTDDEDDEDEEDLILDHTKRISIKRATSPTQDGSELESALLNQAAACVSASAGQAATAASASSCYTTPLAGSMCAPCHTGGLSVGDFELLKVVGRGAYGKVFLCRARATGRLYAMKVVAKSEAIRKNVVANMRAERDVLEAVRHPFIVNLRFAFQTHSKLYLVFDYIGGGELFARLNASKDHALPIKEAKFYAAEIVLAIEHLHKLDIVYRDLKPENIMIHRDGHVVLCDFGFAKAQIPETDRGTLSFCPAVGTLVALAPSASSLLGGDDVAVQSRVLPIECIKPGMQLVGSRGPVTVLAMSPPQSTDVMYNITLADGFAYKVTSDHLVTLRWASAPFIQINSGSSTPQHPELPPNSSEDTLAVVFFTCMDGKLQQCSLPFVHTDTDFQLQQQLRETAMWAQFEAEAAKPGTEASYALRHGMMFEMTASQLADKQTWNTLFGGSEPRATSFRVQLSDVAQQEHEDNGVPQEEDASAKNTRPLHIPFARIEKIVEEAQQFVRIAVDGDHRFGITDEQGTHAVITHNCGTLHYLSPEVVEYSGHGKGSDWWSLGVILFEMLTGRTPFGGGGNNRAAIQKAIVSAPLKLPNWMDGPTKSVLTELLRRPIHKRLGCGPTGAAAIKKHAFFAGVDWAGLEKKKVPSPFVPTMANAEDTSNFDTRFTLERVVDTPVSPSQMASVLQEHGISPGAFHSADQTFANFSYRREHTPAQSPSLRAMVAGAEFMRRQSTAGSSSSLGGGMTSPRALSGLPPPHTGSSSQQVIDTLELPAPRPSQSAAAMLAAAAEHAATTAAASADPNAWPTLDPAALKLLEQQEAAKAAARKEKQAAAAAAHAAAAAVAPVIDAAVAPPISPSRRVRKPKAVKATPSPPPTSSDEECNGATAAASSIMISPPPAPQSAAAFGAPKGGKASQLSKQLAERKQNGMAAKQNQQPAANGIPASVSSASPAMNGAPHANGMPHTTNGVPPGARPASAGNGAAVRNGIAAVGLAAAPLKASDPHPVANGTPAGAKAAATASVPRVRVLGDIQHHLAAQKPSLAGPCAPPLIATQAWSAAAAPASTAAPSTSTGVVANGVLTAPCATAADPAPVKKLSALKLSASASVFVPGIGLVPQPQPQTKPQANGIAHQASRMQFQPQIAASAAAVPSNPLGTARWGMKRT